MLLTILEGATEAYETYESVMDYADWLLGIVDDKKAEPTISERLKAIQAQLEAIKNKLNDWYDMERMENLRAKTANQEMRIRDLYAKMLSFQNGAHRDAADSWSKNALGLKERSGIMDALTELNDQLNRQNLIKQYADFYTQKLRDGNLTLATSLQMMAYMQFMYFLGYQKKGLMIYVNAYKYHYADDIEGDLKTNIDTTLNNIKQQIDLVNGMFNDGHPSNALQVNGNDNLYHKWSTLLTGSIDAGSQGDGRIVTGIKLFKASHYYGDRSIIGFSLDRSRLITEDNTSSNPTAGTLVDTESTTYDDVLDKDPNNDFCGGPNVQAIQVPAGHVAVGMKMYRQDDGDDSGWNHMAIKLQYQKLNFSKYETTDASGQRTTQYRYELVGDTYWTDDPDPNNTDSWKGSGPLKYNLNDVAPAPVTPITGVQFCYNSHDWLGFEVQTLDNLNYSDFFEQD